MHMLDDDHLLSIGYDADYQGDFAWFTGIMLQVFDVSDARDPRLVHKEVIGSRGSTSDAATNHLAFNYYADPRLWWRIVDANPEFFYGGDAVLIEGESTPDHLVLRESMVGRVLRIPRAREAR